MISPATRKHRMVPEEIEPGLKTYKCPASGGCWIPLQSYQTWLDRKGGPSPRLPESYAVDIDETLSKPALLCPESGTILIRYKVGGGFSFSIDRSATTGGVWLDKGEWEALKTRNMHDEIHFIFSAHYQKDRVRKEIEESLINDFKRRVGEADFKKANEFVEWIESAENPDDIKCYLNYKLQKDLQSDD